MSETAVVNRWSICFLILYIERGKRVIEGRRDIEKMEERKREGGGKERTYHIIETVISTWRQTTNTKWCSFDLIPSHNSTSSI